MKYAIEGIKLVFKDRTLWPFVVKPLVFGAFVFALIVVLGFAIVIPSSSGLAAQWGASGESGGWIRGLASGFGAILYAVVLWFVSGILFLAITSLCSAFMWERLSEEVERRLDIRDASVPTSWPVLMADSLVRMAIAIFVAVASLLTGWMCLGIPALVFAGWLGLYDYTGPSYIRRGKFVWDQAISVYRHKGWFGFLFVGGLLTLAPVLNVVLLPGLVAGGAMLRSQRVPVRPN